MYFIIQQQLTSGNRRSILSVTPMFSISSMPPKDSLIFRAFCSQTENRACRCISFLSMQPNFRDGKAGMANRTVFANYWKPFIFGIPFFLEYAIASSYPQPRKRLLRLQNTFLLTNSSRSKRFA